jgi:hypothetical protein
MAAAPHHQQQQLNYFQASPVRGQLEPDTDDTRLGWRYVQCTDTPNQLRVRISHRPTFLLFFPLTLLSST